MDPSGSIFFGFNATSHLEVIMTLGELYNLVKVSGTEAQIKEVEMMIVERIREIVAEEGDSMTSVEDALASDIYA